MSTSGFAAVLVRVPTWLLEELGRDAIECGRSRSSQIIWILRQRFPDAVAAHKDDVGTRTRGPRRFREDEAAYIWNVA